MSDELETVRPGSVAELGDAVRRAAAAGQAVYPRGGGTILGLGLPPARPGIAIDLRRLDQVIDYPARDMTITVQAGITVARLREILAAEKQQLPIDVPGADRATLGGILATNTSGPRRYGYGTLRDYVLGITVVNDEGQETKAGGRVVKNVAGYDLCKLNVGALGTLGVITQATLKLKPLPEAQRLVTTVVPGETDLAGLLDRAHASQTRPVCVELVNAAAAREANRWHGRRLLADDRWTLLLDFEGNAAAVAWQVEQWSRRELPAEFAGHTDCRTDDEAAWIRQALAEFPLASDLPLTVQANLLPGATAALCTSPALADGMAVQAHAGNGIVIAHGDGPLDRAKSVTDELRKQAVTAQGNVIIRRCPEDWKQTLPVWGEPRGDLWLMRRVKEQLDPRGIFNPGRFVC